MYYDFVKTQQSPKSLSVFEVRVDNSWIFSILIFLKKIGM